VLRYAAFGSVTVLRDRTARLTQPTHNARSAQAGRTGNNVGVGCVETQHVESPGQRQISQDCF